MNYTLFKYLFSAPEDEKVGERLLVSLVFSEICTLKGVICTFLVKILFGELID